MSKKKDDKEKSKESVRGVSTNSGYDLEKLDEPVLP